MQVCRNCFGYKPCFCNNKKYVDMWDWVYKYFKSCKGS